MSETERFPQHEGYVEKIVANALHWLNVVGHYDHDTTSRIDTKYNRANDEVFRYLGDRMAGGDWTTAVLLSSFERQAQQVTSESSYISDAEAQDTERTNTFYFFAQTMNRYVGRPYDNS